MLDVVLSMFVEVLILLLLIMLLEELSCWDIG